MRLRLPDGRRLALGGPGDLLRVRFDECRGALLDAFYDAPWHPGETHLRLTMRNPDLWRFRFPWPGEDGACLDEIAKREPDYRAPTPLFVPMELARGLEHDHLFLRASRWDGSFEVRVRVPCPHLRARNGIHVDVAWEEIGEQGRPFTVFECSYCQRNYVLGRREVAVLRDRNEPDPNDDSERARTLRAILQRLRPHQERFERR